MYFYCGKVKFSFGNKTDFGQPEILVSNHANSFFDAILIAVYYPKEIYFLARGDAFKNIQVARILKKLHLIPIYRISEGKENLTKNTDTFEICTRLLKRGKSILIFAEGNCVHEWNLRPFKKGAARLAQNALEDGNNQVQIIPISLNYNGFENLPRAVIANVNIGVEANRFDHTASSFFTGFNREIYSRLKQNLIVDKPKSEFLKKLKIFRSIILLPFALLGFASQYWLFFLIKTYVNKITRNTVFYDSALFVFLMFLYPVFVAIIAALVCSAWGILYGIVTLIMMPLTAWCAKQLSYDYLVSNFTKRH